MKTAEKRLNPAEKQDLWRCALGLEATPVWNAMMNASAAILAGPRIELRTERESFLQVLDEDAHFRGHPAACRPNSHDRHGSLKRRQQTKNGAFPQFRGEQPCRPLCNPKMFKDTHPHLFDIAGPKDSRWDNALCT